MTSRTKQSHFRAAPPPEDEEDRCLYHVIVVILLSLDAWLANLEAHLFPETRLQPSLDARGFPRCWSTVAHRGLKPRTEPETVPTTSEQKTVCMYVCKIFIRKKLRLHYTYSSSDEKEKEVALATMFAGCGPKTADGSRWARSHIPHLCIPVQKVRIGEQKKKCVLSFLLSGGAGV